MFSTKSFAVLAAVFVSAYAETRSWKQYKEVLKKTETDPEFLKAMPEHVYQFAKRATKDQANTAESTFNCPSTPSNGIPNSVHKLRPSDIKVVAAMGDSLTAGNGIRAWTPIGCLTEYRGYSWSIGGQGTLDDDEYSVPNLLRTYTPDLKGYSTGKGGRDSKHAKLNVAEPGNVASDMPYQARLLVDRVRAMDDVDFENDWKLVTLFIGGNDLCEYCYDEEGLSVENYKKHIKEALDHLHANLPRTFVNVVSIFDVTPLAMMSDGLICKAIHWAVCNCPKADQDGTIKKISIAYANAIDDLIGSGIYDSRDDFTAVVQPFMKEVEPPILGDGTPDMSYFAPDCFHFSQKGQNSASKWLYSAMFEPVGQKRTDSEFDAPLECPHPDAYLATAKNSVTRSKFLHPAQRPIPVLMSVDTVAEQGSPEYSSPSSSLPVVIGVACSIIGIMAMVIGVLVYQLKFKKPEMENIS